VQDLTIAGSKVRIDEANGYICITDIANLKRGGNPRATQERVGILPV